MKRKGIGTLGQIGHKLSDNEKRCSHHVESDQMSAVYRRNNQVITRLGRGPSPSIEGLGLF